MRTAFRKLGALLFIGIVIFAPFFELFDQGQDLQEGADFVQALLLALTFGTLAVLLKTIAAILFGCFQLSKVHPYRPLTIPKRRPGIEASPPEFFIALCAIRI